MLSFSRMWSCLVVAFLTGSVCQTLHAQGIHIEQVMGSESKRAPELAQEKIREALDKLCTIDLAGTSLERFATELSDRFGINVRLDRVAIEDAGFGLDTELQVHAHRVSLRSALRWALKDLRLTYRIDKEGLYITSIDESQNWLVTNLYNVTDLVFDPRQPQLVQVSPTKETTDRTSQLVTLITESLEPDSWQEVGGAGSIQVYAFRNQHVLAVSQTTLVHEAIDAFLTQLRETIGVEAIAQPDAAADARHSAIIRVYRMADKNKLKPDDYIELIKTALPEVKWGEQGGDHFAQVAANAIVVRHNESVQQNVHHLLRDVGALYSESKPLSTKDRAGQADGATKHSDRAPRGLGGGFFGVEHGRLGSGPQMMETEKGGKRE